jgi:hypothetical protein
MNTPSFMSLLSPKQCFFCQLPTSTSTNLLKETIAGNFIHEACKQHLVQLEVHTPVPLTPTVKKKRQKGNND